MSATTASTTARRGRSRAPLDAVGIRLGRDLYRLPGVYDVLSRPAGGATSDPAAVRLTPTAGGVTVLVELGVAGPAAASAGRRAHEHIRLALQRARLVPVRIDVRLTLLDLEAPGAEPA